VIGAPNVTPSVLQRRMFVATQAAPGGGKSRFLDLLASLCGVTELCDAKRIMALWLAKTKDPEASQFRDAMAFTVPITVTFNDWQTDSVFEAGSDPTRCVEPPGDPLALRILHRCDPPLLFHFLRRLLPTAGCFSD
jgi:hypothetical protein